MKNPLTQIRNLLFHLKGYIALKKPVLNQNKIFFDNVFADVLIEDHLLIEFPQVRYQFNVLNTQRFYTDLDVLKILMKSLLKVAFKYSIQSNNPVVIIKAGAEGIKSRISIEINSQTKLKEDFNKVLPNYFTNVGVSTDLFLLKKAIKKIKGNITFFSDENFGTTTINVGLPDLYMTDFVTNYSTVPNAPKIKIA